jgi:hypothetical protein
MPRAEAQYVIFLDEVMLAAPLEEGDSNYLRSGVLPHLSPLSDEEYMQGPAVILHTLARYSYILWRKDVYWCSEWEPGLIVVRFSPDGGMVWAALRSPIPNFGGRRPTAEDRRNYDPDAENHQYNLVFNAWDAQFDEDWRKWRSFERAELKTAKAYQAALAHVNELGEQMQTRYSDEAKFARWTARCKRNLRKWAGKGIRVTV